MIEEIKKKLKKLMKLGVVVSSDDSDNIPVSLVNYMGKLEERITNLTPFGLWSIPKAGMISTLFNINASESNKFGITNEYKNRPIKNKKEGEVVSGNLLSHFYYKEDGTVSLFINNVEILNFDSNGNMALIGNLSVTGAITATDDITADGDIEGNELQLTGGLKPYSVHTHTSGGAGNPTGPPL